MSRAIAGPNGDAQLRERSRCAPRGVYAWMAAMAWVLARVLALASGWMAALVTAVLAGMLLHVPVMPVLLASGALWTCLLLLR